MITFHQFITENKHKVTLALSGLSSKRREHEFEVEADNPKHAQKLARKQLEQKLGPGAVGQGFRVIKHEETASNRTIRHK